MTAVLAFVALAQAPVPLADLPFEFHNGQIWLKATLLGSPIRAILDTGASASVVDLEVAKGAGATFRKRRDFGGVGPARVSGWMTDDLVLALGGGAIEAYIANALPIASLSPDKEHALGSILGYDFFKAYVVEIDPKASRVRTYEAATYRPPAGFDALEFQLVDRIPTVTGLVRLPGMEAQGVTMEIDTGSAHGIDVGYGMVVRDRLDKRFAKSPAVEAGGGLGGTRRSRPIGSAEGELGRRPFSAPGRLILSGRPSTGLGSYDVTLGNAALRGFTLIFDYSRSMLYVKPA